MNTSPIHISCLLLAFCLCFGCQEPEPVVNIQPSPPIPVIWADSPEEVEYLAKPFLGVTADGSLETNLFSIKATGVTTQPIQEAVSNFLASLSSEQLAVVSFPIDADEWRRWHNIDIYERVGLPLFEMDSLQTALAFNILATSLSPRGLQQAKDIMAMEEYLKRLSLEIGSITTEDGDRLGRDKYYFTFMGTPNDTEPWGWQIDGHHLVINYFVLGDQVVMTPTFMGSEPNYIESGPDAGTRTFELEAQAGLDFYHSLDEAQRSTATLLKNKTDSYSQAEAFRDNALIPYSGISANNLNTEQKTQLLALCEVYIGRMEADRAAIEMEQIKAHLEETWFCWVGGSGEDDVFYYRIHSPVLMIEFDHHEPVFIVEPGSARPGPMPWHVHTVVRTPNGNDYGKDLLRQHLEEAH